MKRVSMETRGSDYYIASSRLIGGFLLKTILSQEKILLVVDFT